ncbi:hypothetical protein D9O50_00530 [Oxalobacteraceae bacterium CAVE-383]|nr:hypothetical protein D9O50_00530 [Oxalobacteraceae bacterium CAVE-383]
MACTTNPLRRLLLLAVLICTACAPKEDADQVIKQQIAAFYRLHESAPPTGALSLSELIRFRPLLSVALFEKLKDASVAEEAHFEKNGDMLPPLFEGELFTARPQGFSAARVFDCTVNEDHAYCNIDLNAAGPAGVIRWKERLFLVHEEHGWVIDDVDFGHNSPPLRQGRLSALLQAGMARGVSETTVIESSD